ncbi:double-stranded RNA-binding protein Staufen homolog 2 isoform X39 [Leptidea sinapis]|uniref:double-stranded RNA-binding protein Staufen homolog 2 isoform X39 n=1 Tax=Leptidea sinapis TaxID=189913 RepID=UPI0021C3F701|nr:double-stranded RNA-binding protein Staufen homolog 2 isoform X39 [Leptidea sinapis]
MMHHPNMHHQPMSGHPPQHIPGHQGLPPHHQLPPHQMHRENRHVTLTRVPLGPSAGGGGMGGHGRMSGMGSMSVPPQHHQPPSQRQPHPIRSMHHQPAQHHSVPPQQGRPLRRYPMSGYIASGAVPCPHAPHHAAHSNHPLHTARAANNTLPTTGLRRQPSPIRLVQPKHNVGFGITTVSANANVLTKEQTQKEEDNKGTSGAGAVAEPKSDMETQAGAGENEANRPSANMANSKEKTPMCLVNELARYNKIKHQYRLTSETGPAHKKVFTVTLRLGDTDEYTAEGSSIKRAQHAAASAALTSTRYPPPPPRAPPATSAHSHHSRHNGAVMPTVELNALAMKLCQPAVYCTVAPIPGRVRPRAPPFRVPCMPYPPPPSLIDPGPPLIYRVRVCVGGRAWLGEGSSPQAARHDAAARALLDLRPQHPSPDPPVAGETEADLLNSEVKSPVSLVHELALKRNLNVIFSVKSERGPPHMRVFITVCKVGDMETEGEGNGKKVSKRRAAECMLEEMKRRWPPSILRSKPAQDKRRHVPVKKKPRNLIKEGAALDGSAESGSAVGSGASALDNPISKLAVARHAARARSPQYRVLEERGAARRREFLVQCDAPPHCATGLGPNKKTAKRRAAHNVLLAMEMASSGEHATGTATADTATNGAGDSMNNTADAKRKQSEVSAGGAGGESRQPVPGVLMVDYHARSSQANGVNVSESSVVGGGGSSPGAKEQLMYLSKIADFTVQFSDFPKRNHGEYLSLVSLSTSPPVMCHGGGASTALSHEQCARAALRALALMGVDTRHPGQSPPGTGANSAITNGVSE